MSICTQYFRAIGKSFIAPLVMLLGASTLAHAQTFSFTSTDPFAGPSTPGGGFSNVTCYANGGFVQTDCGGSGFPAGTTGSMIFQGRTTGPQSVVALGGDGNPYLSYGGGGTSTSIGSMSEIVIYNYVTPSLYWTGVTIYQSSGSDQTVTVQTFSDTGLTTETSATALLIPSGTATVVSFGPQQFAAARISFPSQIVWGANALALSTSATPVDGVCGTDNGLSLTTTPTNLCAAGSPSSVTAGTTSYDWDCNGQAGGSDQSCSASREYLVTPSSGANGTITPSSAQQVAYNATPAFTVTPSVGFESAVGGTCGGTLAGGTFTTDPVTSDCSVSASFSLVDTDGDGTADVSDDFPSDPVEGTDTDGDGIGDNGDAGGTGIGVRLNGAPLGCGFSGPVTASATGFTSTAPGQAFDTQLDFVLTNCGNTVVVEALFGEPLPAGATPYKITSGGTWVPIPGATVSGNMVTYTITDNGPLDEDSVVGQITDPVTVVISATDIPVMPRWMLAVLSLLFGAMAAAAIYRGKAV